MDSSEAQSSKRGGQGPILIAGGGIGGLATGLALAQAGIHSIIIEKRSVYAEDGAGIQLGPNGTALLRRLGVAGFVESKVGIPEAIEVRDGERGGALARLPLGTWIEQRHGSPYWVAHRQDLHEALLAAARSTPSIVLVLDAELRAIERNGDTVRVRARDGRAWEGSGLIGSDGIWSTTRRLHFSEEAPVSTGISALRATIPTAGWEAGPYQRSTFVWMHKDSHLVHYPVRAGREIAVVCIVKSDAANTDWSNTVDIGWVMERVAGFPAEARALLHRAPQWRRWSLFKLTRRFDFAKGNIALIGDAAHPVMPFLAQGAVMAIEDAVVLAEALTAHADVSAAFASYARSRRERVEKVAAASRRNGEIYHLSGVAALARNASLKLLPGARVMAGYDWLYGWKPGLG